MRSSNLSALAWIALAAIVLAASAASAAPAGPVLIEKVTVISPERETPLRDAFVLLEEGKIRSVGAERPAGAKDVRVVDGRGRFLVPGLIDSHVHVGSPPGVNVVAAAAEDFDEHHGGMLAAYWRQQPRSYLYHGVTAVVDLASPPGSAERFRSAPLAPDLVSCAPLVLEGGYPAVFLPPDLRRRFASYPLPEDPEAAVRLVQRARQDGYRCIKMFMEDGFGAASNWPLPSDSVVEAVRAEARRLGLPVVLHANALDMQTLALRYKPDVLAHGLWNWGASSGDPDLPEPIRQHLDAVLASGAAYQPTFGVLHGLAALFDPQFLDDPALKKVVPPSLLAWYRTEEAQFFKKELFAESPELANPAVARTAFGGGASQGERAFAYLAQKGGRILLGSDTPSAPTWADQPGLNTWRELQHMARAGLSLRELLKAATSRNAEVFGLQDLGTIEPGKTANLLLLSADPLANVEAWDNIETVILHGEPIPRELLAVPESSTVLIEKVTVVSPEREEPLRDAFVFIEAGRIRSVGAERPATAKDVRVIDGRGRFLVPGLIDSHVHVGTPPGVSLKMLLSEDFAKRHGEMLAAYWRQMPRSYLYHGVTAVVDLASPPGSAERFRSAPQAPDLVSCAPLVLEGGYPAPASAEIRTRLLPYVLPGEPEAAARLVQRVQQDGFRCIKLFFEDGFGAASLWPIPSEPVATAVRAEARRLGMPVAIHANALDMQTLALRHKPDALAHGLWHWGASKGEPGLPEPIRQHLDAVLASGAAYQATFGVLHGEANLFDPRFLDDPALKKVVPPDLLAWYRTEEAQFFKDEYLAESPELADPAVARKIYDGVLSWNERPFAYLAQHGGRVVLGSDTPSGPMWTDQPGLNTWRELQHMARAGLSLRELLKAATSRNAEVFGLQDLGTIEPGKTANLLLLSADPLANVEAWNDIETVILHGEPIPRESLAVPESSTVLIEKVTVVSPEREEPMRDAFVFIEAGRIRSVGAERPAAAKDVQVVDGRGRFLVPGLIDSHVHVGMPPGIGRMTEDFRKRHAAMLAAFWRQLPRSYLYHGVTTVVDLFSPPGSAERFQTAPLAPDLVSCAPLKLERGYPGGSLPAEVRSRIFPYLLPEDPAAAARLVQRAQQDGHRCVKLFFEDGFGEASHLPLPSEPVVATVRAEAGRLGLPVAIHANALDMQTLALRHKPDVLAHGLWHWGASNQEPDLPEPIRRHLDAVLASGAAYQATFGVLDGEANLFEPEFLDDPALKKVVPLDLLAWYRTEEAQFFKKEFLDDAPELADPDFARKMYEGVKTRPERAFAYLAQKGGRIVLGSDTPSGPTWTDQPGLNTWRELQHMVRAGLSLRELLKAATSRNAEVFHLQDLGTIEPGKTANLLLLRSDPLASVEAWNDIETVILHGEMIPRESLAVQGR